MATSKIKLSSRKNHNNWLLRNAFAILSIPLSFLTLVLGLYAEVIIIDEEAKMDWTSVGRLLNTKQEKDTFVVDLKSDTLAYSHLLVIDRTVSTRGVKPEEYEDFLKVTIDSIRSKFAFTTKDSLKAVENEELVKKVIFLNYLQSFIGSTKTSQFRIVYYDGNPEYDSIFSDIQYRTIGPWISTEDPTAKKLLVGAVIDSTLTKKVDNQETNFKDIFKEIGEITKKGKEKEKEKEKKFIVSLISDFKNESNPLTKDEIREMNKGDIRRLNLISLSPSLSSESKKAPEKSNGFIDSIQTYLDNDILNTHQINTEELKDGTYTDDAFQAFRDELIVGFTVKNVEQKGLDFFFPDYDALKNNTITRTIRIDTSTTKTDTIKWRVACKETITGTFQIDNTLKTNFKTNDWEKLHTAQAMTLRLKRADVSNKDLHLDVLNPQNGQLNSYKIRFKRTIPNVVLTVASYCLRLIGIVLLLLVLAHDVKIFWYLKYLLNNTPDRSILESKGWLCLEVFFFIAIPFLTYLVDTHLEFKSNRWGCAIVVMWFVHLLVLISWFGTIYDAEQTKNKIEGNS